MTRSVEADHRSRREQAAGMSLVTERGRTNSDVQGQDPVPSSWGTGAVVYSIPRLSNEFNTNPPGKLTCRSERLFCGTEPVRFRHSDGEPDKAQKEIDKIQPNRELENERIQSWGEVIDSDGQHQNTLGDRPDEGTPLDVTIVRPSWEIDLPDGQLRHNIVGGGLSDVREVSKESEGVGLRKLRPGSCRRRMSSMRSRTTRRQGNRRIWRSRDRRFRQPIYRWTH